MFCDEVLETIEAIAAGEIAPTGALAAHLESCANCRAALADARAIDQLLQRRPVPAPPPQFTSRALARIRRERWRSDQVLDTIFNLSVLALVVGAIVGAWLAIDASGMTGLGDDARAFAGMAATALFRRIAPAVPIYAAATILLGAAVLIWWWAERDLTL